jgi:biotin transport system ATP-binding protein
MLKAEKLCLQRGTFTLKNLSLNVKPGETLLLLGANGSGKSLTLKLLSALLRPDSGRITLDGADIFAASSPVRQKLALVLQNIEANILGTTVWDDIMFTLECHRFSAGERVQRAEAALRLFHLYDKKDENPFSLSGGEQRRLAIAGITALDADYYLFDEPFVNLDYPGVISFLEALNIIKKRGKAIVIATHEVEKVWLLAGRAAVLKAGELFWQGSVAEAAATLNWRAAAVKSPFEDPLQWL